MSIAKQESVAIASIDDWGQIRRHSLKSTLTVFVALNVVAAMLFVSTNTDVPKWATWTLVGALLAVATTMLGLGAYGHRRKNALKEAIEKWGDSTGLKFRVMGEDAGKGLVVDANLDEGRDEGVRARLRIWLLPYWARSMMKLTVRVAIDMPPESRKIFGKPGEWRAFSLDNFVQRTLANVPADAMTRATLEEARSRLSSNDVQMIHSDAYQVACDVQIRRLDATRTAGELASVVRSFLMVGRLLWKVPGDGSGR